MKPLADKIAVVTGASRGVGKGVAVALGAAGATVYVTGRSVRQGDSRPDLPGTVGETADAVTAAGGRGIAIRCDHYDAGQVSDAFATIAREQQYLDILVNNCWDGYRDMVDANDHFTWVDPFWQQSVKRWDEMFGGGVRPAFLASRLAAPLMLAQKRGLIVNISYWAAKRYMANLIYGVAKTAVDRMAADMAHDLHDHGIAAVALYPGLVRTEAVMKYGVGTLRHEQLRVPRVHRPGGSGARGRPERHGEIRQRARRGGTRAGIRLHRHRRQTTAAPDAGDGMR